MAVKEAGGKLDTLHKLSPWFTARLLRCVWRGVGSGLDDAGVAWLHVLCEPPAADDENDEEDKDAEEQDVGFWDHGG